ncbi:MAG: site-specific integrase [Hyphomicrobiales bacterium]|nr:MAG: site-specific integrase [Hyphomicrobiales bacterium]
MPKVAHRMTDRAVAALKEEGRHAVGGTPGLHLRISAGHRGWVLRVSIGNDRRDIGLGPYPQVSLQDARDKANLLRADIRSGKEPVTPRAQRAAQLAETGKEKTFQWCASEYIRAKSVEWENPKHRQQWENTLETYAMPQLGRLFVSQIDLPHILACIEPIWAEKNETANRVRGRIESVLDWATVHKYRSGENPARFKGHLDKVLPARSRIRTVKHHEALHIDETPSFFKLLGSKDGYAARAFEFLILTAVRSQEALKAEWSEIDLHLKQWTIPAQRMKMREEHRIPLSPQAVELLEKLPRMGDSPLLFPGTRGQPLSDMVLTQFMRRQNLTAVPHGFRSTFRDWVSERTEFPSEIAEKALAHKVGNKVVAAYQRGDMFEKRRKMMDQWANFCAPLPNLPITQKLAFGRKFS